MMIKKLEIFLWAFFVCYIAIQILIVKVVYDRKREHRNETQVSAEHVVSNAAKLTKQNLTKVKVEHIQGRIL